jgi:hypothetical protein
MRMCDLFTGAIVIPTPKKQRLVIRIGSMACPRTKRVGATDENSTILIEYIGQTPHSTRVLKSMRRATGRHHGVKFQLI